MKRMVFIALIMALCLCSCDNSVYTVKPEESSVTEPALTEPTELSEETIEQSNEKTEPSCESSYIQQEIELLEQETAELLEKDSRFISLVILGGIYKDCDTDDAYTPKPLPSDNEFSDYSALRETAEQIYTAEECNFILSCPEFGEKTVSEVNGKTWYTTHYKPRFSNEVLPETLKIIKHDGKTACAEANMNNGGQVQFNLIKTEKGWRLEKSIFSLTHKFDYKINKSTAMDRGSASTLSGNCLVINVFISDKSSQWNEDAIDSVLTKTEKAASFLMNAASAFGAELKLVSTDKVKSLYLKTDITIPSSMENFVWIDTMLSKTVYANAYGYASKNYDLSQYDSYLLMFHVNKKGRSYAITCDKANYDWSAYQTERCVIFHTEDKNYPYFDSVGVYAHEILHLYGAADLYGLSPSKEEKMTHYFPNEIMRAIPNDIDLASVSPFTAERVGWIDKVNEQFIFLIN